MHQHEHLLEAKVSDIDFKRDWVAHKEEMHSELKHWEPDYKPSQKKGVFLEYRNSKKIHMLRVNDRHSSSHIGRPFFKVYNKQMELEINRSKMKCLKCKHTWKRTKWQEYISFLSRCPKCRSIWILRY